MKRTLYVATLVGVIALGGTLLPGGGGRAQAQKIGEIPFKKVAPVAPAAASSGPKVLVPRPGTAGLTPSATPSPSPGVALSGAERSAVIAKIEASKAGVLTPSSAPPPPRVPFELKPSQLHAGGSGIVAMALRPETFGASSGYFRTADGGVQIVNIPDGAWYVDCSVASGGTATPYEIVIQTTIGPTPSSVTDSVIGVPAASPTHIAFGLILPTPSNGTIFFLKRASPWTWHGCSFTPV